MWGTNVIGFVKSKPSSGHCFILVAIDYFIIWVEIITNNKVNLNNKMMTKMYEEFKIKDHTYSPYIPKMNEALEVINKKYKVDHP
ncbi:hypothetical protein Lal_00021416 [Lupinus albus]|nr:hypothetical protein Lal_00021416 [Lupinus albus]